MKGVNDQMHVNCVEVDASGSASSESPMDDSEDEDGPTNTGQEDGLLEEPLTEEEIEELVAELLEIESKAAEAQEALEQESMEKVEREVREELTETLHGDDLEKAVTEEMATLMEKWQTLLDDLEIESAELLEQLDGAGIDLPSIYKWIETQAPNGCCTEAWRKRAHWVGSQVTSDTAASIKHAEEELQAARPVRRKHGKILEEGASGYLRKKLEAEEGKDTVADNTEVDWSSFNKLISGQTDDRVSFGSKSWSSVYLASTPQQAAVMGIDFPGVDEVEEIDEIDGYSDDPFIAEAVANERELDLSEKQRRNYRKVKEEEDVEVYLKLHHHLKRRRCQKRHCEDSEDDFQGIKRNRATIIDCDNESSSSLHGTQMEAQPALQENRDHSLSVKIPVGNAIDTFRCTACNKLVSDVHQHPLLEVIVCKDCKCAVEAKMRIKDSECSECFCGWCAQSNNLIRCKTCEMLFCISCINRNLGKECLSQLESPGWECCCCSPSLLQHLTTEFKKACGLKDLKSSSSESSESDSDDTNVKINVSVSSKRRKKKRIRRILDDAELGEDTKKKIAIEKERQEHLKSLRAQFSSKSQNTNPMASSGSLPEGLSSEVLGDVTTGFIINVVREKGEDAVRIPQSISAKLKPHQVAGIRFIWENIIQSIRKVKAGDKGLGCILAHTMGLGKTFQVISFLYTVMRVVDLGLRSALVVAPLNVLHNWRKEFLKWRPSELKPLRIFMLDEVTRESHRRAELLMAWRMSGGVFLIGYSSFRNLALGKNIKDREVAKKICSALREGPDILVCDEAHVIKNNLAETTQALKQVKCQRRIALTGSPLQNNLMEYYCMVDFVREGFLGSSHEFRNRFQNPIENGQHTNSTAYDVRIMNQRSHILYEQLKGFVQRMDMSVVKMDLPPKFVFVIAVKLSPFQRKLYKEFLNFHGLSGDKVSPEGFRGVSFFALYQALAQILNHPWILQLMKQREQSRLEDAEKLLRDDSTSDENTDFNVVTGEKSKVKNVIPPRKNGNTLLKESWWKDLFKEDDYKDVNYSGKMVIVLDILTTSANIGDKVLVFSQSISTLDLIEFYLSRLPRQGKNGKRWKRGKDWYRIDGQTKGSDRQRLVEMFNDTQNKRVKCTLISTKAGSLGINLYAANRVVIMDGLWNPTFELQAICRAWRYGQTKPVYAYRLMAHKTMEEKIYKRQVTKEGLAARVVDRQQVHRTVSKEEMLHLFDIGDDDSLTQEDGHVLSKQKSPDSPASCSSDKLMEKLLGLYHPRWIANYHEHETLLQENEEEKLTKEEQDMAWEVYRRSLEMEWEEVQRVPIDNQCLLNPQHSNAEIVSTVPVREECTSFLLSRYSLRNRTPQRRCTALSHRLTLRSQGVKPGCNTICGECAQEVRWEDF